MNREDIEQAIYERTQEFVPQCVYEAILELIASEREACIQIVENEAFQYASPVWAFEIVNDIKARGQA